MKLDKLLNEIRDSNNIKKHISSIREIAGEIANGPFEEKDARKLVDLLFKVQEQMIKIQKREKK